MFKVKTVSYVIYSRQETPIISLFFGLIVALYLTGPMQLRTAKSKLYSTWFVCMIYVYEFIKFSLLKINPKGMHVLYFRLSFGVITDALFF